MIRANKELDLLRSYRRLMRGEKGRSGLLHHFLTPAAVCLLVCVLIWGVLLLMNSSLRRRTDGISDWLRDPAVTRQYSEAADRQQYNDSLVQTLGQVQALTDALATYPQVDSALISRIGAAGGAEVSMALTGYDADSGALRFDAQSSSVIDIPGYVLKLQSLGLFQKVDYTGYTYEKLLDMAASDPDVAALLDATDVLVDGPFVLSERSLELDFRGSRNQRLIDLNRTRAAGEVVLYTPPEW